jgi:hypothetical protein
LLALLLALFLGKINLSASINFYRSRFSADYFFADGKVDNLMRW